MKALTSYLRSLHIAPRKVRSVTDTIKGLRVKDAQHTLKFQPRKAALPVGKLLNSAIANARQNNGIANPEEQLFVKNIVVNEGRPFKRFMPRAQGRAAQFKRRTSHITITLDQYDA